LIAGAVTLARMVVAWLLVPHNYKDWDEAAAAAKSAGLTHSRGPLIGYWLTGVCGLVVAVLGAVGLVQFRKEPASGPFTPQFPSGHGGPPAPYPSQWSPPSGQVPPAPTS
jgi:hypothetical protein